ncbi:hypothetical protein VNO78_05921 [Psophocarpus tetragonolobus]|uniref:Uncharacterized protein n=1 Tax=Psophocarpus tetragonolobus TaxID=3891 RepID=A0AAN9SUE9_PSOTE
MGVVKSRGVGCLLCENRWLTWPVLIGSENMGPSYPNCYLAHRGIEAPLKVLAELFLSSRDTSINNLIRKAYERFLVKTFENKTEDSYPFSYSKIAIKDKRSVYGG